MTDYGALALQIAVIDRARRDYIALRLGEPVRDETMETMTEWLRSERSELFRGGASAESVIANWDEQAGYQRWRKQKKCKKCRKKEFECVHRPVDGDYTRKRTCMKEDANDAGTDD